jgi:hypothetical protein
MVPDLPRECADIRSARNPARVHAVSRLSTKTRNKLPASDFGLPKTRQYPENDRGHAANAKSRATEEFAAGKLSEPEYKQIVAKANRKLKKART